MKITLNNINDIKDFVNECSKYQSTILLKKNKYVVDATSLMGVLSVDTSKRVDVEIVTDSVSERDKFYNSISKYEVKYE